MVKTRYLRLFLLAVSLLTYVAGCAVNPVTGRQELAIMNVSVEQEVALGGKSYRQALQQMGGIYPDKQLNAYINGVGQKLASGSHRPDLKYQFKVVNDSSPNAFALPGGYIAITRGLLVAIDNEAQLAAVLGHEIGHVTARHSIQELQRSTLLSGTISVLGGLAGDSVYAPMITQVGGLTANLLSKRYSREQEFEADQLGIEYMARSGYGLQGAVQLQQIFVDKLDGGASENWVSGLFRTHPVSRERLATNRQIVAQQYATYRGNKGLDGRTYQNQTAGLHRVKGAYALYDQGLELEAAGKVQQAIETYHKALQQAPDHGLLLTTLGMAYLRNEDLIPARRYLLKAQARDADYFKPRLGLGYIYLQNHQYDQAAQQLETSLNLLATLQGSYLLAETEVGRKNLPRARQLYEVVRQADPNGQLGQSAAQRLKGLAQ